MALTHRYWRVDFTGYDHADTVAELYVVPTNGTTTGKYTYSASVSTQNGSNSPSRMYDGSASTWWQSTGQGTGTGPYGNIQYIKIDLGSAQPVGGIGILTGNSGITSSYQMRNVSIWFSDDNVNFTLCSTNWYFWNQSPSTTYWFSTTSYPIASTPGPRYYRFYFPNGSVALQNVGFHQTVGGSNIYPYQVPGASLGTSTYANTANVNAIWDNNSGHYWNGNPTGGNNYIIFDMGPTCPPIVEVQLQIPNSPTGNWNEIDIATSNDMTTWTTTASYTGQIPQYQATYVLTFLTNLSSGSSLYQPSLIIVT